MSKVIDERSLAHVVFTLHWQSSDAQHTDVYHLEKFNTWRDMELLPRSIQNALMGNPVGHSERHAFSAGELTGECDPAGQVAVPSHSLQLRLRSGQRIEPHQGRFYPRGLLHHHTPVFSEEMQPMRYLNATGSEYQFDLNHPLCRYPVEISSEIVEIHDSSDEHGGRCNEVVNELLHGPGMKVPAETAGGTLTSDFFAAEPFARVDETDDDKFYQSPRLVHHLDATAREQVKGLYGRLLQPGMKVIDLMSSWESHLPETVEGLTVSGIGMNEEELKQNPQLCDYRLQDLNRTSRLPYEDNSFDAVICTASVEYLTHPFDVFAEVARVLKPGGKFINVFSNRWFPPKVIQRWKEMHEFERPAMVCDYYRQSGVFTNLNTFSLRGLSRPLDDPHIRETLLSDPIHAVWAENVSD